MVIMESVTTARSMVADTQIKHCNEGDTTCFGFKFYIVTLVKPKICEVAIAKQANLTYFDWPKLAIVRIDLSSRRPAAFTNELVQHSLKLKMFSKLAGEGADFNEERAMYSSTSWQHPHSISSQCPQV
jgi:hypothetical protein